MNAHSNNRPVALIVAAGAGERMGPGVPKQYRALAGVPVLRRTVLAFLHHPGIAQVRVVIHPDHLSLYKEACGDLSLPPPVTGGASRQHSVHLGLAALEAQDVQQVLIHDAARPFVDAALIGRVIAALASQVAVVPVVPLADTVKQVADGRVSATPERSALRAVQTPQGFRCGPLLDAHRRFAEREATDDAMLMEWAGQVVATVEGAADNRKLTTPQDWDWAQWRQGGAMDIATGQGFDVHRFAPHAPDVPEAARAIRLGGLSIPHTHRLEGHSDADAVLHALTDAILGAASAGDIGQHFPPSDARWKGADSAMFLQEALAALQARGGRLMHVDVTVICELPKIGPHRQAMRHRLAELLGLPEARVNIKATTTERLGFTGRGEGLAAQAVATASFP